jgi:hypothetical protein
MDLCKKQSGRKIFPGSRNPAFTHAAGGGSYHFKHTAYAKDILSLGQNSQLQIASKQKQGETY